MTVADHIAEFLGYADELKQPIAQDRYDFIERQAIACYDLMNYSAEVTNLDAEPMVSLDRAVMDTHRALRGATIIA